MGISLFYRFYGPCMSSFIMRIKKQDIPGGLNITTVTGHKHRCIRNNINHHFPTPPSPPVPPPPVPPSPSLPKSIITVLHHHHPITTISTTIAITIKDPSLPSHHHTTTTTITHIVPKTFPSSPFKKQKITNMLG